MAPACRLAALICALNVFVLRNMIAFLRTVIRGNMNALVEAGRKREWKWSSISRVVVQVPGCGSRHAPSPFRTLDVVTTEGEAARVPTKIPSFEERAKRATRNWKKRTVRLCIIGVPLAFFQFLVARFARSSKLGTSSDRSRICRLCNAEHCNKQ